MKCRTAKKKFLLRRALFSLRAKKIVVDLAREIEKILIFVFSCLPWYVLYNFTKYYTKHAFSMNSLNSCMFGGIPKLLECSMNSLNFYEFLKSMIPNRETPKDAKVEKKHENHMFLESRRAFFF